MTMETESSTSIETATKRRRTIDWHDPAAARRQAAGLSGLEVMRGIRDGTLAPPPMARTIDFRCCVAEPGEIVMELDPDESLENLAGMLHGGVAATMLDTAMGAAVNTRLESGKTALTLDLKLTYLRPIVSGPVRAEGRVVNLSRQNGYAEGFVRDGSGKLAVHAVGIFTIVDVPPAGA